MLPNLLALTLIVAFLCPAISAQEFAIRGVTVVDVITGSLKPKSNVLLKDGVIASVNAKKIPATATVVDGTGKFLIPGLWEMHAHVWEKESLFPLYIGSGITGVRDLGSAIGPLKQWLADVQSGKTVGPRVYTAGADVTGPGPNHYPKLPQLVVTNAAEARAAADKLKASGSDFIKPLSPPREAYFALAERAKEIGIPVEGHVPPSVSVREAVDAGQRTIEHMPFALACSSLEPEVWKARAEGAKTGARPSEPNNQRLRETFDETRCKELFAYIHQHNVWVTPTIFSVNHDVRTGAVKNYPGVQFVPEYLIKEWDTPARPETAADVEQTRKSFEYASRIIRIMRDEHVAILAGTDSGDPWKVPGFVLHQELQTLVKAGLTTAQALWSATLEPANLFGIEKILGSVDAGKQADLVLLNADPLLDIGNTLKIEGVFVKGKYLDRAQLDRLLM